MKPNCMAQAFRITVTRSAFVHGAGGTMPDGSEAFETGEK